MNNPKRICVGIGSPLRLRPNDYSINLMLLLSSNGYLHVPLLMQCIYICLMKRMSFREHQPVSKSNQCMSMIASHFMQRHILPQMHSESTLLMKFFLSKLSWKMKPFNMLTLSKSPSPSLPSIFLVNPESLSFLRNLFKKLVATTQKFRMDLRTSSEYIIRVECVCSGGKLRTATITAMNNKGIPIVCTGPFMVQNGGQTFDSEAFMISVISDETIHLPGNHPHSAVTVNFLYTQKISVEVSRMSSAITGGLSFTDTVEMCDITIL